jgi:beta-glucosidase
LTLSSVNVKDTEVLSLSLNVKNVGKFSGKEIIQVYISAKESSLIRPPKELKAFKKIELNSGETKNIKLNLDFRPFAFFHPAYGKWITEDGEYKILIGSSSADIRLSKTIYVNSTSKLQSLLNEESSVKEWMEDSIGKDIIKPMMDELIKNMKKAMGVLEDEKNATGMDIIDFMLDTPLRSILHFQEKLLPDSPDKILSDLLNKLKSQL